MTVTLKLIDHILEKNRSPGGIPLLRGMVRVKAEVGGRRTEREEVGRVDIERSRQVDEAAKGRGGKPTRDEPMEGGADMHARRGGTSRQGTSLPLPFAANPRNIWSGILLYSP